MTAIGVPEIVITNQEFLAIVEKIGEKLGYSPIFEDLPKGDLLEDLIAEVEEEIGTSFFDFAGEDLGSELDREAFAELCIFIFFASFAKYEEIDTSFHFSLLEAIDRTIKA